MPTTIDKQVFYAEISFNLLLCLFIVESHFVKLFDVEYEIEEYIKPKMLSRSPESALQFRIATYTTKKALVHMYNNHRIQKPSVSARHFLPFGE